MKRASPRTSTARSGGSDSATKMVAWGRAAGLGSWPYPVTEDQSKQIANAIKAVVERRQQICANKDIGLTTLYNLVDDGAYTDLKALHKSLDEAVAAACGWPKATAHDDDDMVRRLLGLYREISAGSIEYDPFGANFGASIPMMLPSD